MATFIVGGVENIEYAPASVTGVIAEGTWKDLPKIAPGTVQFTKSVGTKTTIVPEQDDRAFISFFAPGDGDTLAIGLLEQNPEIVQVLFDAAYDEATSLLTYGAKEKIANLAFRITTRPLVDGRKWIITIYNTEVQTTYANNLTKDQVEQLLLTATLGTYRLAATTKDLVYTKQLVLTDGTVVDSSATV
jgi:hypothetical protein